MLDYFNSWRKKEKLSQIPQSLPFFKVWVIKLIISLNFTESTAFIQSVKYNHLENVNALNRCLNVIIAETWKEPSTIQDKITTISSYS